MKGGKVSKFENTDGTSSLFRDEAGVLTHFNGNSVAFPAKKDGSNKKIKKKSVLNGFDAIWHETC